MGESRAEKNDLAGAPDSPRAGQLPHVMPVICQHFRLFLWQCLTRSPLTVRRGYRRQCCKSCARLAGLTSSWCEGVSDVVRSLAGDQYAAAQLFHALVRVRVRASRAKAANPPPPPAIRPPLSPRVWVMGGSYRLCVMIMILRGR